MAIPAGLLGLGLGVGLISQGVTVRADRSSLVPGIVLPVIGAVVVALVFRAGLGVGADHLLVRNAGGRTRRIPWADVTRFEIGKPRGWRDQKGDSGAIIVVCADGRRLDTSGCTTGVRTRQVDRDMVRALEAERLSRLP